MFLYIPIYFWWKPAIRLHRFNQRRGDFHDILLTFDWSEASLGHVISKVNQPRSLGRCYNIAPEIFDCQTKKKKKGSHSLLEVVRHTAEVSNFIIVNFIWGWVIGPWLSKLQLHQLPLSSIPESGNLLLLTKYQKDRGHFPGAPQS